MFETDFEFSVARKPILDGGAIRPGGFLFNIMMYFVTLWRTLRCHDVCFDIMTYFYVITYLYPLWHTFWCYDVSFYFMTYVFFDIMM